jgi:serine/threonine-protein kinase
VPIARQIAEALEAAHERGIIHRDLKPSNVVVRPDGAVKVLDFGLAKVLEGDAISSPPSGPARELIGTPAYMSPEQAKGLDADKRSDIWAFGAVLYEMLAGRPAFAGESTSDTLRAVVSRDVNWSALPESTPASVRRLMGRCLDLDVKQRLRDIGEARIALNPHATIDPDELAARRVSRRWWTQGAISRAGTAVLAGLLAAALGAGLAWYLTPSPTRAVTRFPLALPEGHVFSRGMGRHAVAISPDGEQIVYAGVPAGLYLRRMSESDVKPIPGSTDYVRVTAPVFSPDGRSIAFHADGAIRTIAVTGGTAVTLATTDPPYGITWGSGGIVFGQGGKGIMRVSATGGAAETLVGVEVEEEAHGPQFLSDRDQILFTLATGTARDRWDKARIVVQSVASGARTTILEGGSDARYLETGHIVYAQSGTIYALPFDVRDRGVTGTAVALVEGVSRATGGGTGAAHFSVSETGTLIYIAGSALASSGLRETMQLGLIDRRENVQRLALPAEVYQGPRVSPDGTRIAFTKDDGSEAVVWIYDLSGTAAERRLTFGGNNRFPVWSADGTRVAFQSDRDGDRAIFWQLADGSGPAERLTTPLDGTAHVPESWSPRGDSLLFSVEKGSGAELWVFARHERTAEPFGGVRSSMPIGAVFSPDGKWVAYSSDDRSRQTIYVQPFPATGAKYQFPAKDRDTPCHPVWSPDGKEISTTRGRRGSKSSASRPRLRSFSESPRRFLGHSG